MLRQLAAWIASQVREVRTPPGATAGPRIAQVARTRSHSIAHRMLLSRLASTTLTLALTACGAAPVSDPPRSPSSVWADLALEDHRARASRAFGEAEFQASTTALRVPSEDGIDSLQSDLRLFRLAGEMSSEDLDTLLGELRSAIAQELEALGAERLGVEDRPRKLPVAALQDTLAFRLGEGYRWSWYELRGFRQSYRVAGTVGAVDVLARRYLRGSDASAECWAIGVCISEPTSR